MVNMHDYIITAKKQRLINKQVKALKDLQYPTFLIPKDTIGTIIDFTNLGTALIKWDWDKAGVILSANDAELIS